jgi:hypothetical protein
MRLDQQWPPDASPILDASPPDPGPPPNDAAPSANGAHAKAIMNCTNHTRPLVPVRLLPPSLWDAPATSHEAAASMIDAAGVQRAKVMEVIALAGSQGATDAEVELETGFRAQSVSPRRGELVTLGVIVDSGQRRRTPSGRSAIVWILATLAPPAPPTPSAPTETPNAGGGAQ